MQKLVCAVMGVALLLGLAGPALAADSPETSARAKLHFEEGTKAFNLGEFKRAVDEYRAAYNAKPDPVFLYNIAQAYRLAGDLGQALFFYRSFLRNDPTAPNRTEVERRVHDLESQIERQKSLSTAPPNGPVAPGSASSESRAPAPREPLPPEPSDTTPKPSPPSTSPAAPESATTSSTPPPSVPPPEAVAAAQPSTAPSAAVTTTATTDRHTPVYKKWWLWTIVGGVVVAGVVVGVVVAETSGPAAAPPSHFGTLMAF